jgi:hypothetical protein
MRKRQACLVRIVVVKIFEPYGKRYQEQDEPVETHLAEILYFAFRSPAGE